MKKTSKKLEEKARDLGENSSDSAILSMIEEEISLTIDQIDCLREMHENLRNELLQIQCYVDTELMQMEDRTSRYSPYRFPEREKLQRGLVNIAKERRKLVVLEQEKLQNLHSHLLKLLHKHAQLKF